MELRDNSWTLGWVVFDLKTSWAISNSELMSFGKLRTSWQLKL